jgi:hypothetical protein
MRFQIVSLLLGLSPLGFAGTWSGYLVSSRCYQSAMNNGSQDAGIVGRDINMALRQCAATYETKNFAIVQNDWTSLKLDAAGNQKAAAIVHSAPKRSALSCVTVHGVRHKNMINTGTVTTASVRRYR